MAKKPRSDNKLASLPPQLREQVVAWLVDENLPYVKVQERLHMDFGVEVSLGALSRFYATSCFSVRSSQAKEFAEHVVQEALKMDATYDQATLALIRQKAFERAYAREGNLDELQILAGIIGDSEKLRLKREQLSLDREKFRQQIKSDVEKGLDALHAEIKGNAAALQLFEKMKALVLASVEGSRA